MTNEAISLRPANTEDEAFLYEIYRSTRAEEVAAWGWDGAQQEVFLRMQFKAQRMAYEAEDEQTTTKIILFGGTPVGQLTVNRTDSEVQLSDISLLTEYRGRGIGTTLIEDLFDEAARAGKIVSLHVLKTNLAAMRLYERLGFETTGESGMHFQMKWTPGTRTARG